MSDKKAAANRNNAQKSTGPKTVSGKVRVSQNARRHGVLSQHLVLENESREEFDQLLSVLQLELQPVGLIEQTLVERIAVSLWRQRRLVRAETADVALKQRLVDGEDILRAANSLGISMSDKRLKTAIAIPRSGDSKVDSNAIGAILSELVRFEMCWEDLPMVEIAEKFPLAYQELVAHGDETKTLEGLIRRLKSEKMTFTQLIQSLIRSYRQDYEQERIDEFVNLYRESAQVRTSVDVIGRYQSTLDNELYKAMRALREAQNWRLSQLASVNGVEEK